ncbi:MAG TPA: hypothetical protein VF511_01420, partial [Chthoniobacterales bacterium]
WDAEGFNLLKPWYEGRLGLADLLSPHNEHRIFFSRLLTLGLTYLNGQWDSMPEMVFDALLCGVIAALCLATLFRLLEGQFRILSFVTVTLWLALPYAHENTLWGFQSSFYFLTVFSLLALWGLILHQPFSAGWIAGMLGALAACLSMGSGFFAALIVGLILVLQLALKQRALREAAPTLLLAGAIVAVSFYFRVAVPAHAGLKAQSVLAWLNFFGRCLA